MTKTFTRFLNAKNELHNEQYPRKPLDSVLEYFRFTKAEPNISKGARLLDIGTVDGNCLH
ncbi:MAG: hypothetical protein OXM61_07365 [Candidatus Poribacteria bacterium]|nr:hypothetical protein [Candidatus Poribacteria bacterium]